MRNQQSGRSWYVLVRERAQFEVGVALQEDFGLEAGQALQTLLATGLDPMKVNVVV